MTVTAHRTIESLQVTVDHEDQIIELFARGQTERGQRFGLILFSVTEDAPHLASLVRQQTTMLQVTQEARLINRIVGPIPIEPVGNCQKLGINTWCRMRLKIHQISGKSCRVLRIARTEKMIETDFEQIRCRCVAGNVPTQFTIGAIGTYHHRQGIPAHDRGQMLFHDLRIGTARKRWLLIGSDCIDVGRITRIAPVDTPLLRRRAQT